MKKLSIILLLLLSSFAVKVEATEIEDIRNPLIFSPPTEATVTVFRLYTLEDMELIIPNASPNEQAQWVGQIYGKHPDDFEPAYLCKSNDRFFGCTVDTNIGYPYSENPVSIPIETDYLLDVISQEMGSFEFNSQARHAQAIATRTYTYFVDEAGFDLNNSTEYHVFLPNRFEVWDIDVNFSPNQGNPCLTIHANLLPEQANICRAVGATIWYITDGVPGSFPDEQFPSFTEYFADIAFHTITNTSQIAPNDPTPLFPHLIGVAEPISQPPVVQLGHGRGLSQRGASRWGYGNLGWRGDLAQWGVAWDVKRILVHYYTGIYLREQDGTIATPFYRWNPLAIDWDGAHVSNNTLQMATNEVRHIKLTIQNSGTKTWDCNQFEYFASVRWRRTDETVIDAELQAACGVQLGRTIELPFTITAPTTKGIYRLRFDIDQYDIVSEQTLLFSDPEIGWDDYYYTVCVADCYHQFVYLPQVGSPNNTLDFNNPVPTNVSVSAVRVFGRSQPIWAITLTLFSLSIYVAYRHHKHSTKPSQAAQ